jgi:hypothetical protein
MVGSEFAPQQVDEVMEKAVIGAILKTGRFLVYRHELELPEDFTETDDYFTFYIDENDSDFDVFTHPELLKLDDTELRIFRELFIAEDLDINKVSELIEKYVIMKTESCLMKGQPYLLLLEKAKKYFTLEIDYSQYNYNTYTGKVKYFLKEGDKVLGVIMKNVEYCNYCYDDKTSVGIQKCEEYLLVR